MMTALINPQSPSSQRQKSAIAQQYDLAKQPDHTNHLQLDHIALQNHLGSVLILTEDGTVLQASENLQSQLSKLNDHADSVRQLPQEIALICEISKQCRNRFPSQNWAMEFDIFTKDTIALRIRSRWLKLEGFDQPCILLIVEDRQQMVQDIVLDEAQDWGLTSREQQVWLLHQEGHTYIEIAEKLFISKNTVKKHMRSIHAKRRAGEES
ncbi:MAG: LuxR C-terminal-related transcriptional regulator [Cyanobacteria bacterium P01_C01_bin.70]